MQQLIKNNPAHSRTVFNIIKHQRAALKRRAKWKSTGLQVPPFLIFSITNRCNLNCQGCYHKAQRKIENNEITDEKLADILSQASELGVSCAVLAGGEPLIRSGLLEITKQFPEMLFLLFTNGTLIDDKIIAKLKSQISTIPVLSIEGFDNETNTRRGTGIYQRIQEGMKKLQDNNILFGLSITVTSKNYGVVASRQFIDQMMDAGCNLFFFSDYIPIKKGTEDMMPSRQQREDLNNSIKAWRRKYPSVFMAISEEDEWGGCLSAGIGFIHINPQGDVEPCPMSPISDTNLKKSSLKEALGSELLAKIRQNRSMLNESEGGCALYDKRDWLETLL